MRPRETLGGEDVPRGGAGLAGEETVAAEEVEERAGPVTEGCINQFREFG